MQSDSVAGGKEVQKLANDTEVPKYVRSLECSPLVLADSYKAGHFQMYPPAKLMTAYGEFRERYNGIDDDRIVVYGLKYYIDQFVERIIIPTDVLKSSEFYSRHGLGNQPYAFPLDMFREILDLHHFPVKIEALPEGSVVYPHTPVFIITAEKQYSHFCTFLETILTMVWYPSCVATLSRHTKTLIKEAFVKSVDKEFHFLLESRLHDFGFRGCTCVEQSVLGGSAHLLNFTGSDTMSACSYVQYYLNGGKPVGTSIPATEHSVMTSWPSEGAALVNLIVNHPGKIIACVMDSYDYINALTNILPIVKDALDKFNCTLVLRPDSGDPVQQVVTALKLAQTAGFKSEKNKLGFIVFERISVIQGDGISYTTVKEILDEVFKQGFSAQNVAFGMGGGLLQKVNRDTMSFATKLSYIEYDQNKCDELRQRMKEELNAKNLTGDILSVFDEGFPGDKQIMKVPLTDKGKTSLPGKLMVLKEKLGTVIVGDKEVEKYGPCVVYAEDEGRSLLDGKKHVNAMITVYDNGLKERKSETFDDIKTRVETEWAQYAPHGEAISPSLRKKQESIKNTIREEIAQKQAIAEQKRIESGGAPMIPSKIDPDKMKILDEVENFSQQEREIAMRNTQRLKDLETVGLDESRTRQLIRDVNQGNERLQKINDEMGRLLEKLNITLGKK